MGLNWKLVRGLVAGVAVCLAATAAISGTNSTVLVRFNGGETITQQDLNDFFVRRIDMRHASRSAIGVQAALREIAMNRALVLEGEAMGERRREGREKDRFDDVYSLAVYKKLAPVCEPPADTAAARKFFDANPQAFRVPPMVRVSRAMLPASESVDGVSAGDWLMQQAQAISTGSRRFDEVAERASSAYKMDPQGDLGWVTLTDDARILRALADAKVGEMVGPVREGDFVYLFSVLGKREVQQLAWEDVAASVPNRAVRYCREQAAKQMQERMFQKYGVVLDQSAISALFNKPGETVK
jgi:hypothetical protein